MKKAIYKTLSKKEKYKFDKRLEEENITSEKDKKKLIGNLISVLFGNTPNNK